VSRGVIAFVTSGDNTGFSPDATLSLTGLVQGIRAFIDDGGPVCTASQRTVVDTGAQSEDYQFVGNLKTSAVSRAFDAKHLRLTKLWIALLLIFNPKSRATSPSQGDIEAMQSYRY